MPDTEMVVMVAITAALVLVFIAILRLIAVIITHKTIRQKVVTYDLARQMEGATEVKTSAFADAIVGNM